MREGEDHGKAPTVGLVLPGGGARGAYQAGVLAAIAEMVPAGHRPFPVITGTSVGAINAVSLATGAADFHRAAARLEELWRNLRADNVYRTDALHVLAQGARWIMAMLFGGMGAGNPQSFLDNRPLAEFLDTNVDFDALGRMVKSGDLQALGISASSYATGRAITFFEAAESVDEWQRARRRGLRRQITCGHVMASAALPFLFPAEKVDGFYYGDGSLRLTAPLSPAIHLGADRLLVIGVRDARLDDVDQTGPTLPYPGLGDIGGYLLDVIFSDNLEADMERLERINRTLGAMRPDARAETDLRPIDMMMIQPSSDVRPIAKAHVDAIPRTIRLLLKGLGAHGTGGQLASFLLFEPAFTHELMAMGRADVAARKHEIKAFLGLD
ncbi:patatin-like phospholipase family protein [Yunchengibacter salinarum]|uniref:patatin-like phospholipase family protein n=1 Tax=Yunchengibacter salinarum TaxID=3133399 RepID=UPI0035B63378